MGKYPFASVRSFVFIAMIAVIYGAGILTPLLYKEWNKARLGRVHSTASNITTLELCSKAPLNEEILQKKIQEMDSTHVIRRYGQQYALFNIANLWREKEIIHIRRPGDHPAIEEIEETLKHEGNIEFDETALGWSRVNHAQPVEAMRLTFRGNGIPRNIREMANNPLLEPKLHAFYNAIMQPNTTILKNEKHAVHFNVLTYDDKIYKADSTPFVAIQKISKTDLAKMQSAALPFLWKAYSNDALNMSQEARLTRKMTNEAEADLAMSPAYILNRLAPAAGTAGQQEMMDNVSGFALDEEALKGLYYEQLLSEVKSSKEQKDLLNYWFDQLRSKKLLNFKADSHLNSLANYDSEFSALFIVNNLFEQYNLFSAFKKGVSLRINAIDTRLNIVYLSYDIMFDPVADVTPVKAGKQNKPGCEGKKVKISNEFFLITAKPHSYLIQAYLPDCHMTEEDYKQVNNFLNSIRISNTTPL